jgi:maltooligosyltrehalose trehalohydrolase
MSFPLVRRFPVGAEVDPDGAHFRVWAPAARDIQLVIERDGVTTDVNLEKEPDGYYAAFVPRLTAGARYQYRLDGELCPDPASRFQPDGPSGPSQVVDSGRYQWAASPSSGIALAGQVIYELHIGTFTPEGTWRAAAEHLPELARIGVTVVEVMPIAEFPGRFGWGYDGVFPYAPTRLYGSPDDFRAFVDQAHQLGLAVILDVVYNHFGPDGCVFRHYASEYFAEHYANEWGEGLNFDGPGSAAVREFFSSNAAYWISEFRLDGLRLDATQSIHDLQSPEHVIALIARRARQAAGERRIILIAENESQLTTLVRSPGEQGYGLDALWNDDFHHSAVVALTGRREAYYTDHAGKPQEFVAAAKYGYLYQGQRYAWQKKNRGTSTRGLPPAAFVNFIENHDQVANSGDGSRLHTRASAGKYRAMTALFLLMPGTPMLFQGQEFGSTAPFLYFADHKPELAAAVQQGRAEFVAQFPSFASARMQAVLPVPQDPATFQRCKLNRDERRPQHLRLFTDVLALRRSETAFKQQRSGAVDGAVLESESFVLRYETPDDRDVRLLIVNLGVDVVAASFPEPLLAPPPGYTGWTVRWSSEDPDYGGLGTAHVVDADGWHIPGFTAVVLEPTHTEQTDGRHRTNR